MSDACEGMMMEPSPEHHKLQEAVGKWNVDCKYFMDPSQPPMETRSTETVEALGPFWVHSRFDGELMGNPFQGRGQAGFDPTKGRWISTWIDSMNPAIFMMEGGFDADGKVLTMAGPGPDHQGGLTDYRTEEIHHDKDHRTMSMFMNTPGGECKLMELEYRRAQ